MVQCEFCGADNADGHRVATNLGQAAVLCPQCQAQHGKRPGLQPEGPTKSKPKSKPKPKKRRKSKDATGQLYFPFYHPGMVDSADADDQLYFTFYQSEMADSADVLIS